MTHDKLVEMSSSSDHHAMSSLKRALVLVAMLLIYLILGAVMFSSIEQAHELARLTTVSEYVDDFKERHRPCLNPSDVDELITLVESSTSGVGNRGNASQNRWGFVGSLFFSATVVTTIGYGRTVPETRLGINMCIVYAFFGIPLTACVLAKIGYIFRQNTIYFAGRIHSSTMTIVTNKRTTLVVTWIIIILGVYVLIIGIPAVLFAYMEGWSYEEAHYFCFTSLTTIGFGDRVAASSELGSSRYSNEAVTTVYTLCTVFYLILGLSVLAILVNLFQNGDQILVASGIPFLRQSIVSVNTSRSGSYDVRESNCRRCEGRISYPAEVLHQ